MDVEQKSRFTVTRSSQAVAADQRAILLADPGFGRVFTDHMVTIRYTEGQGWHSHKVGPREPFQMDPACAVLHYAQEIFEGMTAESTPLAAISAPAAAPARNKIRGGGCCCAIEVSWSRSTPYNNLSHGDSWKIEIEISNIIFKSGVCHRATWQGIPHSNVPHGNSVIDTDRIKFEWYAPRFPNRLFDNFRKVI